MGEGQKTNSGSYEGVPHFDDHLLTYLPLFNTGEATV